MSSPPESPLAGKRVAMLVWNEFTNDARVTREATSLIRQGALVTVTAVGTRHKPPGWEKLPGGISVERVAREVPTLTRLLLLPRAILRRLSHKADQRAAEQDDHIRMQPDRYLAFLFEELAVNLRMLRSARGLRPDVVHAHDVNVLVPAWVAARTTRAKLVYDAHEISADREGYAGRVWLIKLIERLVGRRADGWITTTDMRAKWFVDNYGYPEVTVLQNRPVPTRAEGSNLIRARFGIASSCPIVIYQGGLQEGRGLTNLIRAVESVPACHLVFIGDGAQRAHLEEIATPLAKRVHFAGKVSLNELPSWTASADIGVQTLRNTCLNHYSTDSNKLFEYVMAGIPVVASDFPEIRKIVNEWRIGILVEPEDVQGIASALRQLIEDRPMRETFKRNARHARRYLDWPSQESQLIKLYKSLTSTHKAAPHICLTFWGNLQHDARVVRTAEALVAQGAKVTVVCADTTGRLPRLESHPGGFLVIRVRRPSPRKLRVMDGVPQIGTVGAIWAALRGSVAQVRLLREAWRTGADVFHVADIFPLPMTTLVARLRRRPLIYEAYEISTDREGFQPIARGVHLIEGFLMRRAEVTFTTTDMRARHFEQEYGISRPRILQNRPPYRPHVQSRKLREHCGIAADQVVVLYQGGLQPGRGLFNLLAAAQTVENAAFVLLGNGVLQESISEYIGKHQLARRVHLLPAVPAGELHEWTCSADIGIQIIENTCLNHWTTDSNKLFEYVMAGLPVVASDFPEIRRVVDAHCLGYLVQPDEPEAIAAAIQRLVDDPVERRQLESNALRAAERLSWSTQVPNLIDGYRAIGVFDAPAEHP